MIAGGALAIGEREQKMFGGDELVLHLVGLLRGAFPGVLERAPEVDVERRAVGAWQTIERAIEIRANDLRIRAELGEDPRDHAGVLVEQREQQMLGADLRVMLRPRNFA